MSYFLGFGRKRQPLESLPIAPPQKLCASASLRLISSGSTLYRIPADRPSQKTLRLCVSAFNFFRFNHPEP
ncbi:MAG: hypothetical protein MUF49_14520 [Oculatellaceae cyanobacterium Prado106]|jgi:hypothetical protein|nr:hypothetical protein [Oculatellaceae cyanobacterium Prado106]